MGKDYDNIYAVRQLLFYKYFFFIKVGNFKIEQYLNWLNTLLNIKNSIVNFIKQNYWSFYLFFSFLTRLIPTPGTARRSSSFAEVIDFGVLKPAL